MSEKLKLHLSVIQAKLDLLPSLYLSNYKKPYSFSEWDMKDFILQLLVSLSESCSAVVDKTEIIDSAPSKRRSLGDIYRHCKYYYDNVTLLEVQYWLSVLIHEKKIDFFYCNSVKKRVYMAFDFYKSHTVNPVQYASPDEHKISDVDVRALHKYSFNF